jgi:uncharacterized membrane protein
MVSRPGWVRPLLSDDDLDALARAVTAAEATTSGEIRVHLERRVPAAPGGDPVLARARDVFARLGMTRTAARNGVLIYLAVEDHRLAVVGDEGIHARAGEQCWTRVRDLMVDHLRAGHSRQALLDAIAEVGRVLAAHFPRRPDDRDELPNRPSVG